MNIQEASRLFSVCILENSNIVFDERIENIGFFFLSKLMAGKVRRNIWRSAAILTSWFDLFRGICDWKTKKMW